LLHAFATPLLAARLALTAQAIALTKLFQARQLGAVAAHASVIARGVAVHHYKDSHEQQPPQAQQPPSNIIVTAIDSGWAEVVADGAPTDSFTVLTAAHCDEPETRPAPVHEEPPAEPPTPELPWQQRVWLAECALWAEELQQLHCLFATLASTLASTYGSALQQLPNPGPDFCSLTCSVDGSADVASACAAFTGRLQQLAQQMSAATVPVSAAPTFTGTQQLADVACGAAGVDAMRCAVAPEQEARVLQRKWRRALTEIVHLQVCVCERERERERKFASVCALR
jgi:type IV secretory pathway VirB10-like protein